MKALLIVCSFIFLFAACTKKKNQEEHGLSSNETLRINITTEPPSLDWNKSTDTTSALIQDNIMDGLVEYNLKDPELTLMPSLATKWVPSEDSRVWTFFIRQNVKWNDGMEFVAQHVLDGWQRLLNPKTASEYAYFLYGVKNARAYSEGKITDFSQVGVSVKGKYKLIVELEKPMSYFPNLLTHHSTYPIRKDIIAKHGEDNWVKPGKIVTLGAFNLKSWEHDKSIVLERNESYYGSKPQLKYILAHMIIEPTTAINLFDAGKLDAQNSLPSTELNALRKRPEYKEMGNLLLYYYGLNTKKPPMDNPMVRKAISYAIDRKQVVQMLNGGQIPMTSWIPAGMFGYEAGRGIDFDVQKAKQMLKQAGYEDAASFPKITIGFNTNEDHKRVAENIQAQLKTNLGINVELKNEEWKVYLNRLKTDAPHIYRMGWLADYPDPDNFMNLMTSYSDNNHTNWGNKKYDELIEKAATETSKDRRRELYSTAQQILVETDVPVIPLYSGVSHMLVNKRVKNYPVNVMGRFKFKEVKLR